MRKSRPPRSGSNRLQWIQSAIKQPGALRRTAKRMGLVKGNEPLSASDLHALEAKARKAGNPRLLRRVHLARTLKNLSGK